MDENFKKLIPTKDSQFELSEFDPTKVQNKTLHDTTVRRMFVNLRFPRTE